IIDDILFSQLDKIIIDYDYEDIIKDEKECIMNIRKFIIENGYKKYFYFPEFSYLTIKQARDVADKKIILEVIVPQPHDDEFTTLDSNNYMFTCRKDDSDTKVGYFYDCDED